VRVGEHLGRVGLVGRPGQDLARGDRVHDDAQRAEVDGDLAGEVDALDGRITVPVDRTFPLSQAADAHAYMDGRRHVGKIVLVP
jgi:NADPH:quinone reductase-like Zn-dependent oxidoreductase